MSGRFPKARTIAEFWNILLSAESVIDEISPERFAWQDIYGDPKADCSKSNSKWCGTVPGAAEFDPLFFEISPREAGAMDPRQRLLLQESWRALEDAGLGPEQLAKHRVGMIVGVEEGDYRRIALEEDVTSNHVGVLAARVAYFLNLDGPVMALNTACSSSLVAMHQACQSLRQGECDLMIVAGVNLMLTPEPYLGMSQAGMLSPSGACRVFDQNADGMVPGEAVAVVVLRKLSRAQSEGDPIYASIIASGTNYDGRSGGITAPSRDAQARLIREVYQKANVNPAQVSYIVTHGTGTPLGDPIEVNALQDVFKGSGAGPASCALTSPKSNFGHTFAASGIVSLISLVLSLEQRTIPASLHCDTENSYIDWKNSPFYVNKVTRTWEVSANSRVLGGVSAFGMSGSNAHLLLEAYPTQAANQALTATATARNQLLVLSAKSEAALRDNALALAQVLQTKKFGQADLPAISHTLLVGRSHFRYRCAIVAANLPEAVAQLEAFAAGSSETMFGLVARGFKPLGVLQNSLQTMLQQATTLESSPLEQRAVLAGVAQLYCQGYIPEAQLLNRVADKRLHLPGYVFAREQHWNAKKYTKILAQTESLGTLALSNIKPEGEHESLDASASYVLAPSWRADAVAALHLQRATDTQPVQTLLWLLTDGEVPEQADLALHSSSHDAAQRFTDIAQQVMHGLRDLLISRPEQFLLLQVAVCGEIPTAVVEGLSGLLRTATRENPVLHIQLIELDSALPLKALSALLAENAEVPSAERIRYRQGLRETLEWVALEQASSPSEHPDLWRQDGTYLITGGAGGIGLMLAEEILARASRAQVIVCGRTPAVEVSERLRQTARLSYRCCDLTHGVDVKNMVRGIVQDFGALKGVLHCAGVVRDALLIQKQDSDFQTVLAPKVQGCVELDLATQALELDFFVLFSSLSAVFGNVGQADYAAANGFMDGFSFDRQALVERGLRHGRSLAIDWPLWEQGGMRIHAERVAQLFEQTGLQPLTLQQAMRALEQGLTSHVSRLMVLQGKRARIDAMLTPQATGIKNESALEAWVALPAEQMQLTLINMIREVLLLAEDHSVDEQATFYELGLDSIHGVKFVRDLSLRVGQPLRETLIFDYPTIQDLAGYLARTYTRSCQSPSPLSQSQCVTPATTATPFSAGVPGATVAPVTTIALASTVALSTAGVPATTVLPVTALATATTVVPVTALAPATTVSTPETTEARQRFAELRARYPELVLFGPYQAGLPILFCVHPMSGDVGIYGKLSEAAGHRFQIIGLRATGFLTQVTPAQSIEAMAVRYASLIQEVDPVGPWHLLGTSMGGTVAYETARELQCSGGTVATLLLVEAPLIDSEAAAEPWSSEPEDNFLMNANFLLISMLHLDPEFRRRKHENLVHWAELEIRADELTAAGVRLNGGHPEPEPLVNALVACIQKRGVTRAASELAERLRSMSTIHLCNLRALNRYRARPCPRQSEIKTLLLRSRTGCATSASVYNPSYLVSVQKRPGAMNSYFEAWSGFIPGLITRLVRGDNHFDLLSDADAVQDVSDIVHHALSGRGPGPVPPAPALTTCKADLSVKACSAVDAERLATPSVQSIAILAEADRLSGEAAKTVEADKLPSEASTAVDAKHLASASSQSIAVIGMSGRFPGGETAEQFFQLLMGQQSALVPLVQDRDWVLNGCRVTHGGFLSDIDQFDPVFFRIPPNEAQMMEPAERLFLMEGFRAIEDAGVDPLSLGGSNWGVFCGGGGDYTLRIQALTGISPHVTQSAIPGRLAYSLNLTGPCVAVDAGCASSLLAVAQACDHLLLNKCEVAIAGGVMIQSTANLLRAADSSGVLSEAASVYALDQRAAGMLPAEGVGVLVLKPLATALRDGDRIYGVIEGWGNNHSGKTNGVAAPSAQAQKNLMQDVYQRFAIDPTGIDLIEANATGTALGDALELEALSDFFATSQTRRSSCLVGSVENHIGHAYQASGVAHLFKVLLALKHEVIPGTLNVEHPLPALAANPVGLYVTPQATPWPSVPNRLRRAALNSFGATGTNVHMVIAQAPQRLESARTQRQPLVPRPFTLRRCWLETPASERPTQLAAEESVSKRLHGIVRSVTGYAEGDIDVHTHLSHYGMDSLMSMRLLAGINTQFGSSLQLVDLLVNNTVHSLAQLLRGAAGSEAEQGDSLTQARQILSAADRQAAGWLGQRLSGLSDQYCVVQKVSAPVEEVASLSVCLPALERLAAQGIAVLHTGSSLYFIAHKTVDMTACLSESDQSTLSFLPQAKLYLLSSQEQTRNLYHTEVLRSSAWNLQHIFSSARPVLAEDRLVRAATLLAQKYDVLRTCFVTLNSTPPRWLQVVQHESPSMLKIVQVSASKTLQSMLDDAQASLLPIDTLPICRIWAALSEGQWKFGFIMHHALADAFTGPLLFASLMELYDSLSLNDEISASPVVAGQAKQKTLASQAKHDSKVNQEDQYSDLAQANQYSESTQADQYWQYTLTQFGQSKRADLASRQYWQEQLAGLEGGMRLPYSRQRGAEAELPEASEHYAVMVAPEFVEKITRFGQERGITFTQLFTAAIACVLVHGMGNARALVRYIYSKRDRSEFLNTPGEFTNVLFLPLDAPASLTNSDYLYHTRQQTFEALRHSGLNFEALLKFVGIKDLADYYRQRTDVMIDSVDLDSAASARAEDSPTKPRFASGAAGQGDAVATLFYQLLKVNGQLYISTVFRKSLFAEPEIRQLTALIIDLAGKMIANLEQPLGELLALAHEPLEQIKQWTDRFSSSLAQQSQVQSLSARPSHDSIASRTLPLAVTELSSKAAVSAVTELSSKTAVPVFTECQRVNPIQVGRPVFWVHGAFGDASVYLQLAQSIERPFYGLQARGLFDDKEPLVGVKNIAAFYVDMIRAVQPQGPYDLGGYSIGGTLAYEIASQLQRGGESINSLTLADPLFPRHHRLLGGDLYDLYDFLVGGLLDVPIRTSVHHLEISKVGVIEKPSRALQDQPERLLISFVDYCQRMGMTKHADWIASYLKKMAEIQIGYRVADYMPEPLSHNIAHVRYFKNKTGLFFTASENRAQQEPDPLLGVDYWSEWRTLLPGIEFEDIDIESHLALFKSVSARSVIGEYCQSVYALPASEGLPKLLKSVTDPTAVTTHKSEVTTQHTNEATSQQTSLRELLATLLYLPAHEIAEQVQLTDYGMDSMLSARLVQHLRLDFGVDLDLVTLATLQTYQQLAQFVDSQVAAQSREKNDLSSEVVPEAPNLPALYRRFPELIALNRGQGRPVFWFHGGLGSVESYRTIAQQVSRPFFGIQARGFMTERQPLRGVEAMAAYYVQIILGVQPVGPYDLGGYSLGGTLAYEVTRQLQELGEQVQTIVMIDSYAAVDSAVNPLFEKRLMLGVVNMALQSNTDQPGAGLERLLHRDDLDLSQDDAAFWQQLLALARSRGLSKSEEQLRAQLLQMSKFGHSLQADSFQVSALTQAEALRGYYFKNASGSFYGALEPYFVVGALEPCFADNAQYWEAWQKNIPLLEIVAVPSSNHVSLLSDSTSFATIAQHCRNLYLTG